MLKTLEEGPVRTEDAQTQDETPKPAAGQQSTSYHTPINGISQAKKGQVSEIKLDSGTRSVDT